MRPLLVVIAVALAAAAAWLVTRERDPSTDPARGGDAVAPANPDAAPVVADPDGGGGGAPEDPLDAPAPAEHAGEDDGGAAPVDPRPVPTFTLEGDVLLSDEGGVVVPGLGGSFTLHVLRGGTREERTVDVRSGRFRVELPVGARMRVGAGELGGTRVAFHEPRGAFDPPDGPFALVGVPIPLIRLVVVDGGGGALSDVRVERAEGPGGARLAGEDDAAEGGDPPLVEGAASPVDLPWIDEARPLWLSVSAPGRAATNVLVDPRRASEREVRLWPEASLEVRVRGPGRARLEALVLHRNPPDGTRPIAATFDAGATGARAGIDAIVFDVVGLAALPHEVRATAVDARGRTVDLATETVDLGAGASARVDVYVPEGE